MSQRARSRMHDIQQRHVPHGDILGIDWANAAIRQTWTYRNFKLISLYVL